MIRLSEIAEIRAGYTFRKPPKGATLFPYPVIQIKDVTTDGKINASSVSTMSLPGLFDKHLVWHGDVVLCARGTRNQAAVYMGDFAEAVAGAQFWVIRTNREQLLPEYLAWYINQREAQQYFASRTHGTYIGMLPKEVVMNLPVPVPPLEMQRKILAVHELTLREQRLLEQLKQKRAELVGELCSRAAEKS